MVLHLADVILLSSPQTVAPTRSQRLSTRLSECLSSLGLESVYVEGVSLTHGAAGSLQHIWTFVEALYENSNVGNQHDVFACTNTLHPWPHQVPSFVGNNYFCDTADPEPPFSLEALYEDDPLWDGEGCGPNNACCQFNNPPWFCHSPPLMTWSYTYAWTRECQMKMLLLALPTYM